MVSSRRQSGFDTTDDLEAYLAQEEQDFLAELETAVGLNAAGQSQPNIASAASSRRQSTRRGPFEETTSSPATIEADRFIEVDPDDYEPNDLQDYEDFTPPTIGHINTLVSPSPVLPAYSPTQRRNTAASGGYSPSVPALPRTHTRFDVSTRLPRLRSRSQSRRRSSSRRATFHELEPESQLYDPAAVSYNTHVRNSPLNVVRYSANSPQLSRGKLFASRRDSNMNGANNLTGLGISVPIDEEDEEDEVADEDPAPVRGRRSQASQEEIEEAEVRSASIERRRHSTEQREREIEERRARVRAEVMAGPYQSKSVPSTPTNSSESSKPQIHRTPREPSQGPDSVSSPISPSRRAAQQARIRAVLDEAGRSRQHVDMSQTVADITRAQREAREAEFAAAGSPGILKPWSPSYAPTTPRRSLQSPAYAVESPFRLRQSPSYAPTTPLRRSQSPAYAPGSPYRNTESPSYAPTSPYISARSPLYAPGSPRRSTASSMGPPPVPSPHSRRSSRRPAGPSPLSGRLSQRDDCNVTFPSNGRTEGDFTALREANAALHERVFELEHRVHELGSELEAVRGEEALISGALSDDEQDEYDDQEEVVAPPKKVRKTAARPAAKKTAAKTAAKKSAKRKADAAFVDFDADSELASPAPKRTRKAATKKQATPAIATTAEVDAPRRSARVQQRAEAPESTTAPAKKVAKKSAASTKGKGKMGGK